MEHWWNDKVPHLENTPLQAGLPVVGHWRCRDRSQSGSSCHVYTRLMPPQRLLRLSGDANLRYH